MVNLLSDSARTASCGPISAMCPLETRRSATSQIASALIATSRPKPIRRVQHDAKAVYEHSHSVSTSLTPMYAAVAPGLPLCRSVGCINCIRRDLALPTATIVSGVSRTPRPIVSGTPDSPSPQIRHSVLVSAACPQPSPTLFSAMTSTPMFIDRRTRSRIRLGFQAANVDVSTIPEDPVGGVNATRPRILLDPTKVDDSVRVSRSAWTRRFPAAP